MNTKSILLIGLLVVLLISNIEGQSLTWNICKRYPKQTLTIKSLSVNPNPPQAGNNFQVTINGDLSEEMTSVSTGQVSVSYGGTPMYSGSFDPCQFLASGSNNKCPLAKGPQTLSVIQQITPMAPSGGPYQGTIVINDQNNNVVACIDFNFMMN